MGTLAPVEYRPVNMDAWRHYLRARLYRLLKRPEPAMTELRAALNHDPRFARAAHLLAYLLVGRGDFDRALPLLEQTVALRPRDAGAWYNLGFAHDHNKNPTRAIGAFREAVRLSPRFDQAWYGLGRCHAALDQLDDAIKTLEEAARLQPMKGHAWYELALVHHRRHEADRVRDIAEHLNRYDRHAARKLILDTQRTDLAHLVSDLRA
jgi:tetratricopeptide (TPR) repeat protein